jgi:hypothetical protein
MNNCQHCGCSLSKDESPAGLCNPCLDAVWAEHDAQEQQYGYIYTDKDGNKAWTPDFEESIGE